MTMSHKLFEWQRTIAAKRLFNPKLKKDREEYKFFLQHGHWKNFVCPFALEWPYLTIPDMIKDKLSHYVLGLQRTF